MSKKCTKSKFVWGEGDVTITRPTKKEKEALLKKQKNKKKPKKKK